MARSDPAMAIASMAGAFTSGTMRGGIDDGIIAVAYAAGAMAVSYGVKGTFGEVESRGMNKAEIAAARKVFGNKIDYDRVQIINGKYLPWQGDNIVMAPDGNIYWQNAPESLTIAMDTFIHEMTHVLQYQHGVNVLGRGAVLQTMKYLSGETYDPYAYDPSNMKAWGSYNIEQQGDIAVQIYKGNAPNIIQY